MLSYDSFACTRYIETSEPGATTPGNGRSSAELTTLNTAEDAPMPSDRIAIAASVKAGRFLRLRRAWRTVILTNDVRNFFTKTRASARQPLRKDRRRLHYRVAFAQIEPVRAFASRSGANNHLGHPTRREPLFSLREKSPADPAAAERVGNDQTRDLAAKPCRQVMCDDNFNPTDDSVAIARHENAVVVRSSDPLDARFHLVCRARVPQLAAKLARRLCIFGCDFTNRNHRKNSRMRAAASIRRSSELAMLNRRYPSPNAPNAVPL